MKIGKDAIKALTKYPIDYLIKAFSSMLEIEGLLVSNYSLLLVRPSRTYDMVTIVRVLQLYDVVVVLYLYKQIRKDSI